ncbi:hypothetical protein DYBT9623_03813 [Dyadobacter sp. CECT 9623]|uniref:PIN domain-containing protein n=1 Tax=Dyadobacter linearis TaxID=2823330 RepID=A0ABM8UUA2_9BACT|nr:hypothetical protein DYBT9623_03813 [Dyadobacter sp. CECT 9623]
MAFKVFLDANIILNLFISRDKKLQTSALNQLPVYDTSEFLKLM